MSKTVPVKWRKMDSACLQCKGRLAVHKMWKFMCNNRVLERQGVANVFPRGRAGRGRRPTVPCVASLLKVTSSNLPDLDFGI